MKRFTQGCSPRRYRGKSPAPPGGFPGLGFLWLAVVLAGVCHGEDWPTAGHDGARSGVTSEQLRLPLEQVRVHRLPHAPRPAWPAQPRWDIRHRSGRLPRAVAFERACRVWRRRVPGNGRIISVWPIRTGVLVDGGVAYCCAGLFLQEGVYMCALDAKTGADSCDCPYTLILPGDTLVVGGDDKVAAFASGDGAQLRQAQVTGRVYSPAGADGRLLVSTDRGVITCFADTTGDSLPASQPEAGTGNSASPLPTDPQESVRPHAGPALATDTLSAHDLCSRRLFDAAHPEGRTVKDLTGRNDATLLGPVRHREGPDGLMLDGEENRIPITDHIESAPLPEKAMAAEAWAVIYTLAEWGGIVGVIQENGGFEKGWLPGNHRGHFAFALSSVGADDGDGRAAYLEAGSRVERGRLYHVVGTYDGREMRLYVNSKLENSTKAQSRRINYPKHAFYEPGAYHDDNELHPFHGDLIEVGVYTRALSEAEVQSHFRRRLSRLPKALHFAGGPYVRHVATGEVSISWQTENPGAAAFEYGGSPALGKRIQVPPETGLHSVHLAGLKPKATYSFRVTRAEAGRPLRATQPVAFDSTTDLPPGVRPTGPSPYPEDDPSPLYECAARRIAERFGVMRGSCLDSGCGGGRLAYELAKRTDLQIIGVEEDANKAAAARAALDKAGLDGVRVTVHCAPLSHLPYASCFATLMVSGRTVASGRLPTSRAEVFRVLRPYGGSACFGQPAMRRTLTRTEVVRWSGSVSNGRWRIEEDDGLWITTRRGSLRGSGEWIHLYADAANTACSGDRLRAPVHVQWFGRPRPRNMGDRHHRASRTRLGKGVILDGIYYDHKPPVTSEYLFCLDRRTGKRRWVYRRPGGSAIVNAAIAVGGGEHVLHRRSQSRGPGRHGRSDYARRAACQRAGLSRQVGSRERPGKVGTPLGTRRPAPRAFPQLRARPGARGRVDKKSGGATASRTNIPSLSETRSTRVLLHSI